MAVGGNPLLASSSTTGFAPNKHGQLEVKVTDSEVMLSGAGRGIVKSVLVTRCSVVVLKYRGNNVAAHMTKEGSILWLEVTDTTYF